MSAQELLFEQIELYLDNRMDPAERDDFEARMSADSFLRASVGLHRDIARAITDKEEIALEEKLKQIGQDFFSQPAKIKRSFWQSSRNWLVAASLLLVAAIGIWMFFVQGGGRNAPEQLFAANYAPYTIPDGVGGLRDNSAPSQDPFAIAISQYEKGAFKQALDGFKQLPDSALQKPLVQMCIGICLLETAQFEEAQQTLQQLVERENHFFKNPASWYLALSYLKSGKKEQAATLLETINKNKGKYGKMAHDLLDKM